ncbi:ABC transporter G family member 3 [Tanacetum coccineum]
MEEIQSQSDNYRSSSSSASSPVSRVPSSNFFYLRKPGSLRQPISFEDSPDWGEDNTDVEVRVEEGGGDSINTATTPVSPSLSKLNSGSLPSPPLPEGAVVARKIVGASIVWKDLTVTIKGKRKYSDRVIKSSNGYALPGTMTVIMGPGKSGKSTLLRALAGRLDDSAKTYGEVFVNGAKSTLQYGSYGFVERKNTLIGSLTVREFLYYSALLQLPGFFYQKKSVVEDAILAMSLGDYANKLIGGHCYMKGLPSGERRRVSIARELVMRPQVLFIDEPLYRLDSVSALLMMVTLKKLASTGCTLVFTIYQSSTEVFGLYDRICLLSNGNTLFFGETLACLQHFSNAGFPCPIMQSPSDHFLRAINTDFDRIIAMCKTWQDDHGDFSSVNMDTAVAIRTLEETYRSSADSAAVETMIHRLTEREGPTLKSKGKASSATRIAVLTWRSLLIMSREWKYFWLRLILCMLLALCVGTAFSDLGHSLSSVGTRVAAIFVFVSFASLLSIVGVPAHLREVKVYACEDSNQHSGGIVFLTGQILASFPFLFLISISSSLVFYFLVGLRNDFSFMMYFVLNFFMCLLVNEGMVLVVATILQDMFWSISTLVFIHVVMMLSAGYFRIRSALPGAGLLENEYDGTSFAVGQVRTISGYQALHNVYDVSPDAYSKWKNLLILSLMALGCSMAADIHRLICRWWDLSWAHIGGLLGDVILKNKLKRLKSNPKIWADKIRNEASQRIIDLKAKLMEWDSKAELGLICDEDIHARETDVFELMRLNQYEQALMKQKSRIKWVVEDRQFLEMPITMEEVKRSVWDCAGSKSPGPDGFNFNFIKRTWEIIKSEFFGSIKYFEENSRLCHGCNTSFISHIPKVSDPIELADFRPFSLIGCVYKALSKVLATRLTSVIHKVVRHNQTSFISRRQILDGALLANKIISFANRSDLKLLCLKVDFEKAFDCVCWSFLDDTMVNMGFGDKWPSWIHEYLSSASISVLVNGSPTREFLMRTGLRQGDPLSPYLFLIVAESLQVTTIDACSKRIFYGISLPNVGENISLL